MKLKLIPRYFVDFGFFVAYAGEGSNSPYAQHLIQELKSWDMYPFTYAGEIASSLISEWLLGYFDL